MERPGEGQSERNRRHRYCRLNNVPLKDLAAIERMGFDKWKAAKDKPFPDSVPGRVIIGVVGDFRLGFMKWIPKLDGDANSVLEQNRDWLSAELLDSLLKALGELGRGEGGVGSESDSNDTEDTEQPQPRSTMFAASSSFLAGTFVLSACIGLVMFFFFGNSGPEAVCVPALAFVGVIGLASHHGVQFGPSPVEIETSIAKFNRDITSFAELWSAKNECELRFVKGELYPGYFEFSPSVKA